MKKYWGDFHSNIHTKHIEDENESQKWLAFAKQMVDFWAPVYYPFQINTSEQGFQYEALVPKSVYEHAWEKINTLSQQSDYIVYPSYEWQGDGRDGDHNVFFLHFNEKIIFPKTYTALVNALNDKDVIAIPHHPGYKPGHRGKNWATHNEKLSPVAEIYSSHGSSEEGEGIIPLSVHIHMAPRSEEGTVFNALKQGVHVGIIASGDSHNYPTVSGNGFFAVYAEDYDREAIFDGIKKRHTYAVTRSKIDLYYTLNGELMGGCTQAKLHNECDIRVTGTQAIKMIEVIRNGICEYCYHYYLPRVLPEAGRVKFKFELELGWGPDQRSFPDLCEKQWNISVSPSESGKICDYELLLTSPGCDITQDSEQTFAATVTTRKEHTGNGKLAQKNYLTPFIQNQSIIFEMEDDINNNIELDIDELHFSFPIRKILSQTTAEAKLAEVEALLKDRYQFTSYEREDPWWHNAYKFVVHRGALAEQYQIQERYTFDSLEKEEDNVLIKVTQFNGDTAWSSPVYIRRT